MNRRDTLKAAVGGLLGLLGLHPIANGWSVIHCQGDIHHAWCMAKRAEKRLNGMLEVRSAWASSGVPGCFIEFRWNYQ